MARVSRIRPLRRAALWEDRFWRTLEGAVPREVRAHLRNARQEILLAAKSVIDGAAARSERASRRAAKPGRRTS